jgi:non-heme chloroperoxidase
MRSSRYAKLEIIRRPPRRARHAPALLFVHGAYAGAWCWDEFFLDYFAGEGYDCHAVSLRGHGGSGGARALDETGLDDYVEDVRAAAERLDAPPVVVGHSMGGVVAQRYVALHGAAGLVLLASVPPYGLMGSTLELCFRDPDLLAQFALIQSGHGYLANPLRLSSALFASDMPLPRAFGYFARMQRESQRALLELAYLPQQRPVSGPSVPVAVIGGEEDGLFRPDAVRLTAARHDAQASILPGLGHTMMLDCRWLEAARYIARWLEENVVTRRADPPMAQPSPAARRGRPRSGSRR